jgi:hypothetical protein
MRREHDRRWHRASSATDKAVEGVVRKSVATLHFKTFGELRSMLVALAAKARSAR